MPVISRTRGYLFLMAPRTGCTAVAEGVLIPQLGGEYLPPADVVDEGGHVAVDHKHATMAQLKEHGLLAGGESAGLFKFTTVRNPFDALITQYVRLRNLYSGIRDPDTLDRHPELKRPAMQHDVQLATQHPFSQWVEIRYRIRRFGKRLRRLRRFAGPRHMYRGFIDGADFVMRYEHLQEDFHEVLKRLGVAERIEIPRLNVTEHRDRDYRAYYTPKAKAIVEKVFSPDLERFGYGF